MGANTRRLYEWINLPGGMELEILWFFSVMILVKPYGIQNHAVYSMIQNNKLKT